MRAIQQIFSRIPHTYELINHILTCGFDMCLRRYAARWVNRNGHQSTTATSQDFWLDVCCGTGEMAYCLSYLAKPTTTIIAADFTPAMLHYAAQKPRRSQVAFTLAEATNLPFPSNSFDLITISFSTRNINLNRDHLLRCLKEFHRILKPGGQFINLETSQPASLILRKLFHTYVKTLVKPIGTIISGSAVAYRYLAQTIPRFYDAPTLARIIKEAGFNQVVYYPLVSGLAALHAGIK